ncbi:hypothetical protein TNCV_2274351 [Trichonephila clavipes]|nr:hypothetical protein TNCV_2274351 [Trichonephila clavipes]
MFGYCASIVKCDGGALMFEVSSFFGEAICTFITLNVDMCGYPLQDFLLLCSCSRRVIISQEMLVSPFLMASIADLESEKITNPSVESITCGSC